jgi:hypothetical protein|tara:strand:- start:233 stop:511 length:279 start_codon:yes stop_codon:yes gene_type:complete
MARNKMVDGVVMALTAEEEAQCDKDEKAWADGNGARQMEAIRRERDQLLSSTDWTANSDVTMSDAMKTYRQMLRDIPASNTVYDDVDWGTKP